MNRLFAFLMMPFFVVSISHAHSQGVDTHLSPEHARPHIHVGIGSHHTHYHGHTHTHGQRWNSHNTHSHSHQKSAAPNDGAPAMPVEHDSDAVYLLSLADSLFTSSQRSFVNLDLQGSLGQADCFIAVDGGQKRFLDQSPKPGVSQPLYLLHAALRL